MSIGIIIIMLVTVTGTPDIVGLIFWNYYNNLTWLLLDED